MFWVKYIFGQFIRARNEKRDMFCNRRRASHLHISNRQPIALLLILSMGGGGQIWPALQKLLEMHPHIIPFLFVGLIRDKINQFYFDINTL